MLEIVIMRALFQKLSEVAARRGVAPNWAFLGPALWFLGELVGGFDAGLLGLEESPLLYVAALGTAALGGGLSYWIVTLVPVSNPVAALDAAELEASRGAAA